MHEALRVADVEQPLAQHDVAIRSPNLRDLRVDLGLQRRQRRHLEGSSGLVAPDVPEGLGALKAVVHGLQLLVLSQAMVELQQRLGELRVFAEGVDATRGRGPHVAPHPGVVQGHARMRHGFHAAVVRVSGELQPLVVDVARTLWCRSMQDLVLVALPAMDGLFGLELAWLRVHEAGGRLPAAHMCLLGDLLFLGQHLGLGHFVASGVHRLLLRALPHDLALVPVRLADGPRGGLRDVIGLRPIDAAEGVVALPGFEGNLREILQQARSRDVPLGNRAAVAAGLLQHALLGPVSNERAGATRGRIVVDVLVEGVVAEHRPLRRLSLDKRAPRY
mmetsp:Transcript_56056/g.181709  ORF Transcript_56056/g.181709 Transcript_56056/m.181709 type:complete len:333 (-) Transcript_56056:35-1033(-)